MKKNYLNLLMVLLPLIMIAQVTVKDTIFSKIDPALVAFEVDVTTSSTAVEGKLDIQLTVPSFEAGGETLVDIESIEYKYGFTGRQSKLLEETVVVPVPDDFASTGFISISHNLTYTNKRPYYYTIKVLYKDGSFTATDTGSTSSNRPTRSYPMCYLPDTGVETLDKMSDGFWLKTTVYTNFPDEESAIIRLDLVEGSPIYGSDPYKVLTDYVWTNRPVSPAGQLAYFDKIYIDNDNDFSTGKENLASFNGTKYDTHDVRTFFGGESSQFIRIYKQDPLDLGPGVPASQIDADGYTYLTFGGDLGDKVKATNGDVAVGSTVAVPVKITAALGVNDAEFENVSIYPNPSTGIFHITGVKNIKNVNIFDITGKNIYSKKNTYSVNISDKSKGFYFLKVETEKGSITKKIIID
ncbi:T9SS type A sorting domain-containing protein [Thalassobellus suaedae]|uniref:T9SS type A sorting domain-containing protein n=1 Tax=Thalassobellus suaedae TaxID=3074124 RepID=A0ABY9XXT6_9FLAO|nr:T9SS type A sorting domain-containing protein [Flavobacteriaceae bacterium HL-DH14]